MTYIPPDLLRPIAAFRGMPGRDPETSIGCGVLIKNRGWDVREFTPNSLAAVLCLHGSGTYTDATGRAWPIKEGTLFLRRTGQAHSLQIHDEGRWAECWIVLAAEVEELLIALGMMPEQNVIDITIDLTLLREIRRTAAALTTANDRALRQLMVRLMGILVSLLDRADASQGSETFDLNLACRLLSEDPRANLRFVARELGLTWERFRKLFRQSSGISPGAYRLRRRLERAQAELLADRRSINEIATDLGYANPFTFSRLFHRHVGCTPTAWRAGGHHASQGSKPAQGITTRTGG
jgi:AraC family transcriptional regulator, arabinose operon regulatory protein